MADDRLTPREEFETLFCHFIDSLIVLSETAAAQCEIMQHHFSGWEIKQNVIDLGEGALAVSPSRVPKAQELAIRSLINELRRLPESAITAPCYPRQALLAASPPWDTRHGYLFENAHWRSSTFSIL